MCLSKFFCITLLKATLKTLNKEEQKSFKQNQIKTTKLIKSKNVVPLIQLDEVEKVLDESLSLGCVGFVFV